MQTPLVAVTESNQTSSPGKNECGGLQENLWTGYMQGDIYEFYPQQSCSPYIPVLGQWQTGWQRWIQLFQQTDQVNSMFRATMFRASMFRASMFRASMFRASMFRATMFRATMFRATMVRATAGNSKPSGNLVS